MAKFWLCAAVGFYLLQLCLAQIGLNISCRYAGVFHVEKNRRYSLTREEAVELCKALNSTIPTWEQMEKAYTLGLETCRYGYIEDKIVLPRHTPYHLCAANNTGIYILTSNISERYDTFCFNASEKADVNCDPVIKLYSVWPNNESKIEIFNSDGSRFIDGKRFTERPPVTDDDISMGSGSANDRVTTDPSVIRHGISQNPHSTDDVTSNSHVDEDNEESTYFPSGPYDHHPGNQHPESTTVVSSGDVKYEDSTHDSLLQGVPSGRDSEVKYSRNGTREVVPPGIVPLGDDEHNSTATAVFSSDDFFKPEDSHQHSQDGAHPGFETEDIVPTTTTTSNVLHPGLVPSVEREGPLREELFHHTVVSFNESAEHEESHQDQLSAEGISGPGSGQSSATNRTIHDVLEILTLPSKSGHENESSQTALTFHDASKHEDTSHDSQTPVDHPRSDTEESYPTNKTSDDVLHSFVSSSENESGSSHKHINMESNDGMKHEESTQNPIPHGVYPEWASEERYPTNTSSKEMLPGIVPQSEHEHKNDSIYTVVPSDFTHYEDSTHDTIHSEWDSEKQNLTNASGDHLLPGIFHPAENEHEKEPSHTAVASSDNGKHEDATKEPVLHGRHPGWDSEDDHPRNTTRDDVQPGIIPPRESHQEMPDTAVASNGGNDYEDSAQDPLNQETHPGWNDEHRHPENASKDELVPVIIPPSENVNEKETSHLSPVVIHNDHEDSTQQPLPPHQPGWYTEEKYPTTTSRDDALIGDNEHEHDPLSTDVVYDGTKEDSTPEPVRQWGGEDKYTTKSTADALFPGIVPRRGINQNNKTDHTAVVSSDGAKNEESTQDPQLHSLHPGWSNEDEHLVNNTQDYVIPGVSPEIDSGFERHPTSSTASPDPDKHGRKVSHTGIEDVSPLPGEIPKSQPRRAHIPDWLIVVASLLALSLILGVCIAVNSRRRCGQKKKLVINNGKGGIDQKNMGGLNGEASKSQEMVHLVHNEKPEDQTSPHDEFLAIDETQKQQDVALKSGM